MTQQNINSSIEAAMNRASRSEPASRRSLGRRDYDQALSNRLEQLRVAMGEPAESTPAEVCTPATIKHERPTAHSTIRLLLASGLSAILGAGLTWLFMSNPGHDSQLPPAAPPASIAKALPISAPEPAKIVEPVAAQPELSIEQKLLEFLEQWRSAWVNRDVETYLHFYAPDFSPEDQSHNKWVASRRTKLASNTVISIQIRDVEVERLEDAHARLTFLQDYASGNYQENGRAKTLLLKLGATGWKIIGEQQASQR